MMPSKGVVFMQYDKSELPVLPPTLYYPAFHTVQPKKQKNINKKKTKANKQIKQKLRACVRWNIMLKLSLMLEVGVTGSSTETQATGHVSTACYILMSFY